MQKKYWILTIAFSEFHPPRALPEGIEFIRGQAELGNGGFHHWQIVVAYTRYVTLSKIKTDFGRTAHAEPTRSAAANEYVFKEETKIAGTEFELGELALKRNSKTDWEKIRQSALNGHLHDIPGDIYIKHYANLRRIEKDNQTNKNRGVQQVHFLYGPTGTGKSHLAHELVGECYYEKQPSTKWFDGYNGQSNVLIEEFRGEIGISHLLRWLDKYACSVEIKGGQVSLATTTWVITSNLSLRDCYPGIDEDSYHALLRRITEIKHLTIRYQ